MSITIQVPAALEHRLREKAAKKGIGIDQFVAQFLERNFPLEQSPQSTLSKREADLLQKINLDIPAETWDLYLKLKEKRQENTATDAELIRLLEITDQVEAANAKRIAVLAELSQIRGIPLRALMEQLGLAPTHE